ncbi:MAG: SsrA-binding protein SmpB [Planctomycetes bacterium]|nr:SsrA-binding protein SmpB [Planctomycetota bacterium]MCB9885611.1 SsrA-binding protein SmpB [Planctomycetota bacterium]
MAKQGKSNSAAKPSGGGNAQPEVLVGENRKARFRYEILETVEAGLVLRGTEVKVLRQGQISLDEAYARAEVDSIWLIGANIPEYSHGNLQNHEPKRKRKCLLHKKELRKLRALTQQQGLTLVPLRVYFGSRGFAKVTIGVGKGRKTHDKREHLKAKDAKREIRDSR